MNKTTLLLLVSLACFHNAMAERYAILVGNSTAEGNFAPLKYVENDLNLLQGILGDFCGFEKERTLTLLNGKPSDLDNMLTTIAGAMAKTKNNMLLFYYSGHADQNSLKMGSSVYPLISLKEKLTAFPSDIRIGIFDACQSGSFTRIKGGKLDEPFLFKDDEKTKGQVILCSSSINENAQEFDVYSNSIFTFHFVNALRGSADVSGDGKVTLSEAYQYAYNHTLSSTAGSAGGIQHPSYQFRIQGEGDIVLADLNLRSCGIILDNGFFGSITIFNEKSGVVADLSKENKSVVMIALNPGLYRVVKSNDKQRLQTTVEVRARLVTHVKNEAFVAIQGASSGGKKGGLNSPFIRIGISPLCGFEFINFAPLKSDVEQLFSEYNSLSINPQFPFPKAVLTWGAALNALVNSSYEAHIGLGTFNYSNSLDYNGFRLNSFDNKTYGYKLHTEYSLSAITLDMGAGYRFLTNAKSSVYGGVGFTIYDFIFKLKSNFSDSLFNVETQGEQINHTRPLIPYIAMGYSWRLGSFSDIGTKIRYRYQKAPKALLSSEPAPCIPNETIPLRYDFNGVDACIFIDFHFTLLKSEELL